MRSLLAINFLFISQVWLDESEKIKWNTDDGKMIPTVEITYEGEIIAIPLREAPFCRLWETHQCLCFMLRKDDNTVNWNSASFSYCEVENIRGHFLNNTDYFEVRTIEIGSIRQYDVTKEAFPPGTNYTEKTIDDIGGNSTSSYNGSLYFKPLSEPSLEDYETGFLPCFFVIDPIIFEIEPIDTIDFYLQGIIDEANEHLREFNLVAMYTGWAQAKPEDLILDYVTNSDGFISRSHRQYIGKNARNLVFLFTPKGIRDWQGQWYSGRTFEDSICYPSIGIYMQYINRTERFSMRMLAQTFAHEIGHTLGLIDIKYTDCKVPPEGKHYIMGHATNDEGIELIWSACSKVTIGEKRPSYFCLKEIIKPPKPSCRNGILEDGEKCECVSEACRKCCNNECQLTRGSKCSSGPCCNRETCKPRRKNEKYTCRKARDLCDIPEMCSGRTHKCPLNYVVADGYGCRDSPDQSYCFNGMCGNRMDVCNWMGHGGQLGPERCYDLNLKKNSAWGCGPTFSDHKNVSNLPCEEKDKYCGKLLCNYTAYETSDFTRAKKQQRINDTFVEVEVDVLYCHYLLLRNNTRFLREDPTFVQNGSACGLQSEKMCIKQNCVSLPGGCPKNCPGKLVEHPETKESLPAYIIPDPDAEPDETGLGGLSIFQWFLTIFPIFGLIVAIALAFRYRSMSERPQVEPNVSMTLKTPATEGQTPSVTERKTGEEKREVQDIKTPEKL